jgi:hypothetical protein
VLVHQAYMVPPYPGLLSVLKRSRPVPAFPVSSVKTAARSSQQPAYQVRICHGVQAETSTQAWALRNSSTPLLFPARYTLCPPEFGQWSSCMYPPVMSNPGYPVVRNSSSRRLVVQQ